MTRRGLSKRKRFSILRRDHFRCQYCGRSAKDVELEVDHIIPVKEGGRNDRDNLLAACRDCNRGKAASEMDWGWVAEKQALLASGDASFYSYDEIMAMAKETYEDFCRFRDHEELLGRVQ